MNNEDAPTEEIISDTTPKAEKEYICALCKGIIKAGEEHTKLVYIFDGSEFVSSRYHLGYRCMKC